jgi:hypothetical protein
MDKTFQILAEFLDRYGEEVEGRELQALPEDVQCKLRDFARGTLPAAQRTELIGLLHGHPQWIDRLAQEVKTLREEPEAKA